MNYSNVLMCDDTNVKQLFEYIYESPADVIGALALALDSLRFYKLQIKAWKYVLPQLYNYSKQFALSTIKSHLINKFICVRGTVLWVSSIKVLVKSIVFECNDCKDKIQVNFVDGKWAQPNKCAQPQCHSRFFVA